MTSNPQQDDCPKRFRRLRKSLRTSWWIFAASKEPPRSVLFSRITLVISPFLVGLGIGITLHHFIPLIPAILIGMVIFLLIAFVMIQSTPEVERRVESYLDEENYIDTRKEYHPSALLLPTTEVKPVFYHGVGEWMAVGHVPLKEFINTIQTLDQFVDALEYHQLEELVEYNYAVNTYSPRRRIPVLKLTDQTTPEAYPVTRLRAPYDKYVSETQGFPDKNMPPSPVLPLAEFDRVPDTE